LGNLYTLNKTFSLEWKEEQNREENLTHKLGRDLSRKMEEVATDFDTRFFFGGGTEATVENRRPWLLKCYIDTNS